MSDGSVTAWILRLKAGDSEAEFWLFNCYFRHVARIARERLGDVSRTAYDEEDVAGSVFRQFLHQARGDAFHKLEDRNDLHQLLLLLTRRTAMDYFRKAVARARFEVGESVLCNRVATPHEIRSTPDLQQLVATDPPPALDRELVEEITVLFDRIECDELQLVQIALMRLSNFSNADIATELGCLVGTVKRRLNLIRRRWEIRERERQFAESAQAALRVR